MLTYLRSLVSWARQFAKGSPKRPICNRPVPFKLLLEMLEDRTAPADLGLPVWPTYQHDDMRTGASTVAALITTPTLKWAPAIRSGDTGSPAVGVGAVAPAVSVFSPSINGVYNNNNATGVELWHTGSPAHFFGNGVYSNPTVDSAGNVYVTLSNNTVQKVAPAGGVVWQTPRPDFSGYAGGDDISTDPFVPNITILGAPPLPFVYFGAKSPDGRDGMVYAAADANGALTEVQPVIGTPISISSDGGGTILYVRTDVPEGNATFPAGASLIYAINTTTNAFVWPAPGYAYAGSPDIVGHGQVAVNSAAVGGPFLYYTTGTGKLVQARTLTGTALLSVNVGSGIQMYPSINLNTAANIVYVSGSGKVHAYDATTLAPLWTFSTTGSVSFTSPALAISGAGGAGALYFVTLFGHLYSIDAVTGAEIGDVTLQTLLGQPPSGQGGGVYMEASTVIDQNGDIIYNDQHLGPICITNGGAPFAPTTGGVRTDPLGTIVSIILPAVAVAGQTFTATASVDPVSTTSAVPTGALDFYANGVYLGAALLNGSGSASFNMPGFAAGSYTISAVYAGDPYFFGNTGSADLLVKHPPIANDAEFSVVHDQTLSLPAGTLQSCASDADGDTLYLVTINNDPYAIEFPVLTSNGGTLLVRYDGSVEYTPAEGTAYTDTFSYTVSDGLSTSTGTITILVTNDAPIITSDGGGAAAGVNAAENQTAVTTVTATDADGDTPTFHIAGDADAAKFAINASTGVLTFVAAPNFEVPTDADADNVFEVSVEARDGIGGANTEDIAVTVTNVNEAPTDITLSNAAVAENRVAGTTVGTLSAIDPDSNSFSFSLVEGTGATDNASFTIVGDQLRTTASFDYETKASYSIRVQATDAGNLTFQKVLTISVGDVEATVWSDTFTDTDHTAIEYHTPDVGDAYFYNSSTLQTVDYELGGIGNAYFNPGTTRNTISFEFTLADGTSTVGCIIRFDVGGGNAFCIGVSGTALQIYEYAGGYPSVLTSETLALSSATQYTLTITDDGNNIVASIGSVIASTSSATGADTYTTMTVGTGSSDGTSIDNLLVTGA